MFKKIFAFLLLTSYLFSKPLNLPGIENETKPKLNVIYKNIDTRSIIQNFAFYNLYPDTNEGKQALKKGWNLLNQKDISSAISLPILDINMMISLVNKKSSLILEDLDENQLVFLESLGADLKNRSLKGHNIWSIKETRNLNNDDIDLSRALFLEDFGEDPDGKYKIRYYEITLDLMALQILANLDNKRSDLDIINAMNDYIFYIMRFRFPPHSVHAKHIDTFTFLSTVMDSQRGVCLGVSTLYLTLAQRLGVKLESITPPGHIYVRYVDKNGNITNIETTARGVDYPSDVYLGIETKKLEKREIKEVVGLAFINQASVFWSNEEYEKALQLYEKASYYIKNDSTLDEMIGLNYLFTNNKIEGEKYLLPLKDHKSEYSTYKDSLIEDYFNNKTDVESIKAIFTPVDETRESILKKQDELKKIVDKFPFFRAGLMQLANTYLQLGREKEALIYLNKLSKIDALNPVVNYYLSAIYFERLDYLSSLEFFKKTYDILNNENHIPKAIRELKFALKSKCPDKI